MRSGDSTTAFGLGSIRPARFAVLLLSSSSRVPPESYFTRPPPPRVSRRWRSLSIILDNISMNQRQRVRARRRRRRRFVRLERVRSRVPPTSRDKVHVSLCLAFIISRYVVINGRRCSSSSSYFRAISTSFFLVVVVSSTV